VSSRPFLPSAPARSAQKAAKAWKNRFFGGRRIFSEVAAGFGTGGATGFPRDEVDDHLRSGSGPEGHGRQSSQGITLASAKRSPLMNVSSSASNGGWSLTRADMLLCIVPIALFLSIVSFV
jgi:hypothetical protein